VCSYPSYAGSGRRSSRFFFYFFRPSGAVRGVAGALVRARGFGMRAAGPLRRAVALREGGPLAPRVADAGDGLELHPPPRRVRHRDSFRAPLRAASLGHPHHRSREPSSGHPRPGGSADLLVDGRGLPPAVVDAHPGARMRRQQRRRVGSPRAAPTSSGVTAWSAAASGPASPCRCCSPRLVCSRVRHG